MSGAVTERDNQPGGPRAPTAPAEPGQGQRRTGTGADQQAVSQRREDPRAHPPRANAQPDAAGRKGDSGKRPRAAPGRRPRGATAKRPRGAPGKDEKRDERARNAKQYAPDPDTPRTSLALLWAAITLAVLLTGSVVLGIWLAVIAALAAAQTARTWKRAARPPLPLAAAVGCAVAVVGGAFGVVPGAVLALVGVAGAAAWAANAGADPARTALAAALPTAAALPLVLLRAADGIVPGLVLLAYVSVYDTAAFIMGTGARWRPTGPVAGILCIGSVTVAVAAVFPQFKGASPWELGVLAAALTPFGPWVTNRIIGADHVRLPALRRLDSLVVVGPVWALAAAVLLS
jgi:hypothetical protein